MGSSDMSRNQKWNLSRFFKLDLKPNLFHLNWVPRNSPRTEDGTDTIWNDRKPTLCTEWVPFEVPTNPPSLSTSPVDVNIVTRCPNKLGQRLRGAGFSVHAAFDRVYLDFRVILASKSTTGELRINREGLKDCVTRL